MIRQLFAVKSDHVRVSHLQWNISQIKPGRSINADFLLDAEI